MRTGKQAGSTADTVCLDPLNLWSDQQALGVVAPLAAQQAAFEEDRGTDARPIFCGEALQVQVSAGF